MTSSIYSMMPNTWLISNLQIEDVDPVDVPPESGTSGASHLFPDHESAGEKHSVFRPDMYHLLLCLHTCTMCVISVIMVTLSRVLCVLLRVTMVTCVLHFMWNSIFFKSVNKDLLNSVKSLKIRKQQNVIYKTLKSNVKI